jgi:hypothetical protein
MSGLTDSVTDGWFEQPAMPNDGIKSEPSDEPAVFGTDEKSAGVEGDHSGFTSCSFLRRL